MIRTILCLLVVGPATLLAGTGQTRVATVSWELKFRFQDPQRVSVILPGRSEPVVYWYMLYSVENSSNREVDFFPEFTLLTDTMRVLKSEVLVSPEAFQAIRRRSGLTVLLSPEKVAGRLLRGEDQAKHGVAIWRDFDSAAKGFKIYVSGLSSEAAFLKNPAYDPGRPEDDSNKKAFLLRKTLEIPYRLPGSETMRRFAVPDRQADQQKWIMR
jgi:hypothetical protein